MKNFLQFPRKRRKAFTIVELIIVIAVIGVLAAILIPTFSNVIRKANIAKAVSNVTNMNKYLRVEELSNAAPKTIGDVRDILNESEYSLDTAVPPPLAGTIKLYWYSATNELVLVDEEDTIICGPTLKYKKLLTYADQMVNVLTGYVNPDTAVFFESDGTTLKTNVTISKPTQLAGLAELVNHNGESFAGVTVQMQNDIDISIMDWTPIGTNINFFDGTFDGNNFKIKGLTIKAMLKLENAHYLVDNGIPANDRGWGFIGGLYGTLRNVTFTDVNISSPVSSSPAAPEKNEMRWVSCFTQFGTAVGVAYPGCVIDNVQIGTPDDNSVIKATNEVGGIVGKTAKCVAGDEVITISNCKNYATLTSVFSDSPTKASAGGIIGSIFYSNGMRITNCQNYGEVNGATAAGIMGSEKSSLAASTIDIIDCANYGSINGALFAGGVVAHIQSNTAPINLTNFLQAGTVTAKVSKQTYLGRNISNANSNPMQVAYYNYIAQPRLQAAAISANGTRTFNINNVTNTGTIRAISGDILSTLVVGDEFYSGVIVDVVAPANGALKVPTVITFNANVTAGQDSGTYEAIPAT